MPNPVVFCEATNRPIGYVPKGTTEVPERLRAEYGDRLIIISADEALERQESAAKTEPVEITQRKWTYALEVLPPVSWKNAGTRESFKLSERIVGNVTSIYVRLSDGQGGSRYFTFNDRIDLPHEKCCDRVVDALCREQVEWANEGDPKWHERQPDPGWGRIWWVFDTEQELEEWRRKVGDDPWRGSPHLRVLFVDRSDERANAARLIHVIFEVEKSKANEILGYSVGEEEWLED